MGRTRGQYVIKFYQTLPEAAGIKLTWSVFLFRENPLEEKQEN